MDKKMNQWLSKKGSWSDSSTDIYTGEDTLSLHDALPIYAKIQAGRTRLFFGIQAVFEKRAYRTRFFFNQAVFKFGPTCCGTSSIIEDVERGAELSFSGLRVRFADPPRHQRQILFSNDQILASDRQTDRRTDRQTDRQTQ